MDVQAVSDIAVQAVKCLCEWGFRACASPDAVAIGGQDPRQGDDLRVGVDVGFDIREARTQFVAGAVAARPPGEDASGVTQVEFGCGVGAVQPGVTACRGE
jgi:hypothetical protein